MAAEIELATLQDAVRANAAGAVPTDWNGALGNVNLAKPRDYTGDFGKVCITGGHYDLRQTLVRIIWLVQRQPNDRPNVTQDHLNAAIPHFRNAIATYRIYQMFTMCGVVITYRASDVAAHVGDRARQDAVSKELYALLIAPGVMEDKLAEVGRLKLLSIVSNAIHREQNADHSWFTDEMHNKRSPTAKCMTVAGADYNKLKDYMTLYGHDINHHLPYNVIAAMARILCGADSALIPDGTRIGGEDLGGKELATWFDLGEAVKGRFPAGVLGKAALIIGLELVDAMVVNLGSRVKITGAGPISANSSRLAEQLKATNLRHDQILRIGSTLGPLISLVYGFCTTAKVVDEDEYRAFANHAKRYPAKVVVGSSLAKTLARTTPHREAIAGSVVASLAAINESLVAAGAINIGTDAAPAELATALAPVAANDITAEVGGTASASPVETFYDASA